MAKMGKMTPEEEARNKVLMRERDRQRKRLKRMNPEYRKLEQERDRDRKKARRRNEAFRQLEKLRDKLRKERKKGINVDISLHPEFVAITSAAVKQEAMINEALTTTAAQGNNTNNAALIPPNSSNHNGASTTVTSTNTSGSTTSTHVLQDKGLIYPPPGFAHHPLPIAGVTLMPQLCHPILHQNLSASLYPTNSIKQEFPEDPPSSSNSAGPMANTAASGEEQEVTLIEPEIILQTSADIIAAPHHFHNHAHTHHLHQQQCGMFQHMSPHAHMSHMRISHVHAQPLPPPHSQANGVQQQPQLHPPPPSPQQQQQQLQQHYASNKGS